MNIGISFAIFLALIVPMIFIALDAEKNSENIFSKGVAVNQKSRVNSELARLRDQAKIAQPISDAIGLKVPDRDSLFAFSGYVKSLASKYGVTSAVKFGTEERGASYNVIGFNLSLEGDYPSLAKFINDFEESPYFMNVGNIATVRQAEKYSSSINGSILFK